jgi:acyl-CoA thioester hydrolase
VKTATSPEHTETVRVGRSDIDAAGYLQAAAPFRWAEIAEFGLMRRLGVLDPARYPRRHVVTELHRPLVFDDVVDVRLWVAGIGRTSVTFSWEGCKGGERCFDGRHVVVRVDEFGNPEPLTDTLREALSVEH